MKRVWRWVGIVLVCAIGVGIVIWIYKATKDT